MLCSVALTVSLTGCVRNDSQHTLRDKLEEIASRAVPEAVFETVLSHPSQAVLLTASKDAFCSARSVDAFCRSHALDLMIVAPILDGFTSEVGVFERCKIRL